MAAQRKRTIRLYRITEDGRRLLAGTIEAGEPAELVVRWRAFLATAARGTYAACSRSSPPQRVAPMPRATAVRPLALSPLMKRPTPLSRRSGVTSRGRGVLSR
jgi:hypothetical protein